MKKILLTLTCTLAMVFCIFKFGTNPLNEPMKVETAQVMTSSMVVTLSCPGRIERTGSVNILSETIGTIGNIYVKAGSAVKAGDPIATVYKTPLQESTQPQSSANGEGSTMDDALLAQLQELVKNGEMPASLDSFQQYYGLLEDVKIHQSTPPEIGYSGSDAAISYGEQIDIISPVDGYVTSLPLKQGDALMPGSIIAAVGKESHVVKIDVGEESIAKIHHGQPATVSLSAYPEKSFEGYVSEIAPSAKQKLSGTQSNTFIEVTVKLKEEPAELKEGFSAKVQILIDSVDNATLVPYEAIIQDEKNQEIVYIVKQSRLFPVPIETGSEMEDCVRVISGLFGEEQIALFPTPGFQKYQKVK